MSSFFFADLTWPELAQAARRNTVILLPVGTIEEHGKHLPVSTDATIATEVARRVAAATNGDPPVLVMPTIWSGYSQKVMSQWPGTLRVRTRVVMDLVFDICSSLIEMGFPRIVILDTHGHHGDLLRVVAREIADAHGIYIAVFRPAAASREVFARIRKSPPGGAIHGGEWETSLMLYLTDLVQMEQATNVDHMRYHSEFVPGDNFTASSPVFWSTWGLQASQTGVYGDPTVASKETGRQLMEAIVEKTVRFLREFAQHPPTGAPRAPDQKGTQP